jgi:hypothetical protein
LGIADEFVHRGKAAGPDYVFGQIGEEALDKVHPRRGGRREVRLEAPVALKPRLDLRMLMGGVVVLDQMDVAWDCELAERLKASCMKPEGSEPRI